MEKEFVPYELALRMKALGFNEKCIMHWWKGKLSYYQMGDFSPTHTSAPLYQQAFRWFREKHGLGHMINGIGYESFIMNIGGVLHILNALEFKTYEETELACLKKLIEIVKEKL